MFKAISTFIHKTPWWAMILLGFSVIAFLVLFATPFHLLRLSESGTNNEQRRQIKQEIDSALVDSGLGFAEGVLSGMRGRTDDPARKADLDNALEEVARAREEVFAANKNGTTADKKAAKAAADTARETARAAAVAAMENIREAAEAVFESATERRAELEATRSEVEASLKNAGVTGPEAFKAIDEKIAAAKLQEAAAQKALDELNKSLEKNLLNFEGGSDGLKIKGSIDLGDTSPSPPPPPSPPTAPGKPGKQGKPAAPAPPLPSATTATATLAPPPPPAPTAEMAPPAPLPPLRNELRQDIRAAVASSTKRIGVGSILILIFIPLFMMTLIAKFFIDRSRRAIAYAETQTREAEFQSANRQIVEARLQALQAQVEPHFLYNTLANVQALTEVDPPQANKMVGHLIQYLRAALPKMRETSSTVGQEVELVRAYLNILKMRMGERLAFDIVVPKDLESFPFPPLMLPSLVENAIKHGLEPQREGGRIDVIAEKVGDGPNAIVRIIVKDTGRGLTDAPTQAGGGVGLSNIRERLQGLFGEQAKLKLESNSPKGVISSIEVPAVPLAPFSATGSVPRPLFGAKPTKPAEPAPSGFAARTWWIARKTHSVWLRILTIMFIGVVIVLGAFLVVSLLGVATGSFPPALLGSLELSGVEGMALSSVALLAVFCLMVLVAIVLTVLAYGMGVFFAVLLVAIPSIIIVSLFPAMAPFILVGLIVWWFMKRAKKKELARAAAMAYQNELQDEPVIKSTNRSDTLP